MKTNRLDSQYRVSAALPAAILVMAFLGADVRADGSTEPLGVNVPAMPGGMPPGPPSKEDKPDFPKFDEVTKDMKTIEGFFTLYRDEKKDKLFARIKGDQVKKNFLAASSIASGPWYAGWQWLDGAVYWERLGKTLVLMEADPRYAAGKGSTVEDVITRTYTDRIIKAVPILTEADGDPVIDLADLMKADVLGIGELYEGRVDRGLSRFGDVKNFEKNSEITVNLAVTDAPQGPMAMMMATGLRASQVVGVHFSFSQLPDKSEYKTRLADPRVGYFLTVVKDWSAGHNEPTVFRRYVNRWQLRKAEADKEVSDVLPEDQIIFYIEKTVPIRFRQYVRDGILEWNKAFEAAGLRNAIVVRQQTDKNEYKDLDPEDVRYNFFRWIVSGIPYAMGPSRVNPFTGQILDADIVFDDSMIRYFQQDFRLSAPRMASQYGDKTWTEFLVHNPEWSRTAEVFARAEQPDPAARFRHRIEHGAWGSREPDHECGLGPGMTNQITLGSFFAEACGGRQLSEEYLGQIIKEISAHEVGHTLGLRHNFKASQWQSMSQIHACRAAEGKATSASVMDYNPTTWASTVDEQGCFVTPAIGPYDYWAIEYGYRVFSPAGPKSTPTTPGKPDLAAAGDKGPKAIGGTNGDEKPKPGTDGKDESAKPSGSDGEKAAAKDQPGDKTEKDAGGAKPWTDEASMLKGIASRCAEPGHAYATDEDTSLLTPDPTTNRFDNGTDPLEFGKDRLAAIEKLWKDGLDWMVKDGTSFTRMRWAMDMLFSDYAYVSMMASRMIGGQYINRDHKGDPNARPPIQVVSAEKQRETIKFLSEKALSGAAFKFPPALLNNLAAARWGHWDSEEFDWELEYNLHERVMWVQRNVLFMLMNPITLNRVYDAEKYVPADQDAVTVPELLSTLTKSVWSELDSTDAGRAYSNREPFVSSFRRSLQREYVQILIDVVLSRPGRRLYADVHSVARLSLKDLGAAIDKAIADRGSRLDDFTRAHLADCQRRIKKALDAEFVAWSANRGEGQIIRVGREKAVPAP